MSAPSLAQAVRAWLNAANEAPCRPVEDMVPLWRDVREALEREEAASQPVREAA